MEGMTVLLEGNVSQKMLYSKLVQKTKMDVICSAGDQWKEHLKKRFNNHKSPSKNERCTNITIFLSYVW